MSTLASSWQGGWDRRAKPLSAIPRLFLLLALPSLGASTDAEVEAANTPSANEPENPERTYRRYRLWLDERQQPARGDQAETVSWSEFYKTIGGTTLSAYNTRRAIRTTLSTLAIFSLLAGTSLIFAGGHKSEPKWITTGAVIDLTGIALLLATWCFPRHPVNPEEAHKLAAEHNRRLAEELGLSANGVAHPGGQ